MKSTSGGTSPIGTGKSIKIGQESPINQKLDLSSLQAAFKQVKSAIAAEMTKSPELSGLKDSVSIKLTDEGLRIELMEKTASLFFDTGSAKLKDRTKHLLAIVAKELKKRGHTV